MSHFNLLILGDNPEEQLDPFMFKEWDWSVLGGRWKEFLVRRDGTLCDEARKADIDIEATWARRPHRTFAVLDHGDWHAMGQRWFMPETHKPVDVWHREIDILLAGASDDCLVSLYDCHI